jgi:hypothetical protein
MNSYVFEGEKIPGSEAVALLNKFIDMNPGVKVLSVNHTVTGLGDRILVQVQASHDLEYPRKNGQGLAY